MSMKETASLSAASVERNSLYFGGEIPLRYGEHLPLQHLYLPTPCLHHSQSMTDTENITQKTMEDKNKPKHLTRLDSNPYDSPAPISVFLPLLISRCLFCAYVSVSVRVCVCARMHANVSKRMCMSFCLPPPSPPRVCVCVCVRARVCVCVCMCV